MFVACICVCMHVHMCVHARACGIPRLTLGSSLDPSSTLFIKAGSLNQIQSSPIRLFSLGSLFWVSLVSALQGWDYRQAAVLTQYLYGFWRSKLRSSDSQAKYLLTPEPFLQPQSEVFWWIETSLDYLRWSRRASG